MNNIATPGRTRQILDKHDFAFKKSLGQNFIIDTNILRHIVQAAELDGTQLAVEVGPGIGALTEQLAKVADQVLSYEIDARLLPILEEALAPYSNVHIVHQDVLKTDLQAEIGQYLNKEGQKFSVVANLPYYVTTPILLHFLQQKVPFVYMVIMIQKEVAERLVAKPGSKNYGSLSLVVQYYAEAHLIRTVPPTVFMPRPNVDSAVVKLTRRHTPPVQVKDEDFLFQVIQASFATRRKTLLNNLVTHLVTREQKPLLEEVLTQIDIDGRRRGESLSIDEFARLSDALLVRLPRV